MNDVHFSMNNQRKFLLATASFAIDDEDVEIAARRMPTVFWIYSPFMYNKYVLPYITGVSDVVYDCTIDLGDFVKKCVTHLSTHTHGILPETTLLTARQFSRWKALHVNAWTSRKNTLTYGRNEIVDLFMALACVSAIEVSRNPAINDASYKLLLDVLNYHKVNTRMEPDDCTSAFWAGYAWHKCIQLISEQIQTNTVQRVKGSKKRKLEENPWTPLKTPCYNHRFELSRKDPYANGLAMRLVPIQLVMLTDDFIVEGKFNDLKGFDTTDTFLQILIPENAGPDECSKCIPEGILCHIDVTKGVNTKDTGVGKSGKGNTKAGGKTYAANDLALHTDELFERYQANPMPIRLVFHHTSVQQAFMMCLYFAFKYLPLEETSDIANSLSWQLDLQKSIKEDFYAIFEMYSTYHDRTHMTGCPRNLYSEKINTIMQNLVPVILESAQGYKYNPANVPERWWPNLMVKKAVCRSWADLLNKHRIKALGIDSESSDKEHKLTACNMMLSPTDDCVCKLGQVERISLLTGDFSHKLFKWAHEKDPTNAIAYQTLNYHLMNNVWQLDYEVFKTEAALVKNSQWKPTLSVLLESPENPSPTTSQNSLS